MGSRNKFRAFERLVSAHAKSFKSTGKYEAFVGDLVRLLESLYPAFSRSTFLDGIVWTGRIDDDARKMLAIDS